MNTRPARYRSTLVYAALAIGSLGATAAEAHDHGWRGHDAGRPWDGGFRDHERGAYRGQLAARGGGVLDRGRDDCPPVARAGFRVAPAGDRGGDLAVMIPRPL